MQEVTVRCGCGRNMSLDARNGRGAFRCGCGATVRIELPYTPASGRSQQCGYRTRTGPCSEPPRLPDDGSDDASALCVKHHNQFLDLAFDELMDSERKTDAMRREYLARLWSAVGEMPRQSALEIAARIKQYEALNGNTTQTAYDYVRNEDPTSVVYFVRVGDRIKIGTTVNLKNRLRALTLSEKNVAATQPGSRHEEADLHWRFRHLRLEGEWFRAAPELLEYIATMEQGMPAAA